MPRLRLCLPLILGIAQISLVLLVLHNVAYVTTYRFYISHRTDAAAQSAATQRFDVEGTRVVPQIAMRDADRIAFKSVTPRPSMLTADVRPEGAAHYQIRWRSGAAERVLADAGVTTAVRVHVPVPAGDG